MLKRSSILVFSIWVLVFFSILGSGIYKLASSQIRITKRLQSILIPQYLAKAAVVYAKVLIGNDQTDYDTLYELRQVQGRELGKGKFSHTLVDQESKININIADLEILSRIPGFNQELAQKIITSDLRLFRIKEELLAVEGVTKEIFNECKDLITVYGQGENINTASRKTLEILGISEGLISIIESYRAGADGMQITEDDEYFESSSEIITKLESITTLSQEEKDFLTALISGGHLGISSNNFSLEVKTEVFGRPSTKYVIIIDRKSVKEWREY